MEGKRLGKIKSVTFGEHPDLGFGLAMSFSLGDGAGVDWFEPVTNVRQLEALRNWMRLAKINDVNKFIGVPVEVEIKGNLLDWWRILVEVI